MYGDLLGALRDKDSQPLRNWLTGKGVETGDLRELPRWNAGQSAGGASSMQREPPSRRDEVARLLTDALPKVADAPAGIALLLVYLLHEVCVAWESSYHFGPLWDTLRGVRRHFDDNQTEAMGDEATATRAVLALMESVDSEIQAENAMTCGRLGAHAVAADTALAKAREAAELASRLASTLPELSGYLTKRATLNEVYYNAVAAAARGVKAFFESGAPLDEAIAALALAENDDALEGNQPCISEVRAHRFSLAALRDAQDAGWLRVDHGKLIYVYPFAIRGVAPGEVVRRVGQQAAQWRLAGVKPTEVHRSLDLDDVWDGTDPLGRRNDGALVELPQVLIQDLDGEAIGSVGARLRLSQMGNHYVRFEAELIQASPADMYMMMFRAAPEHGTVRVMFANAGERHDADEPSSWTRLSDLAIRLAEDVCKRLGGARDGVHAIARPGMFHVVVSIHAASLVRNAAGLGDRREICAISDLATAVGVQVLTNPVAHSVGSLADWIRYPHRNGLSAEMVSLADEGAIRTCNTVLLVGLGSPQFSVDTRESVAEFAVSLDGLFAGWFSELANYYKRVEGLQERVRRVGPDTTADEVSQLASDLEEEQVRLHDFAIEARSTVTLIRSPSLLSSPLAAERLALLLKKSDYGDRVAELEAKIEEILDERLALNIGKIVQQIERAQRAKLDTMLAVIAALGVSGLGQIIQAGYGLETTGAMWITISITGLAVGVGGWFWRAANGSSPSSQNDSRPR